MNEQEIMGVSMNRWMNEKKIEDMKSKLMYG